VPLGVEPHRRRSPSDEFTVRINAIVSVTDAFPETAPEQSGAVFVDASRVDARRVASERKRHVVQIQSKFWL
jgi:hypothetical protein